MGEPNRRRPDRLGLAAGLGSCTGCRSHLRHIGGGDRCWDIRREIFLMGTNDLTSQAARAWSG